MRWPAPFWSCNLNEWVRHLLTGGHRFPKVLASYLERRLEYEQQLQNYHKSLLTECENPYVDVDYLKSKMDGRSSSSSAMTSENANSLRTQWKNLPEDVKLQCRGRRDWETYGIKRTRAGVRKDAMHRSQ